MSIRGIWSLHSANKRWEARRKPWVTELVVPRVFMDIRVHSSHTCKKKSGYKTGEKSDQSTVWQVQWWVLPTCIWLVRCLIYYPTSGLVGNIYWLAIQNGILSTAHFLFLHHIWSLARAICWINFHGRYLNEACHLQSEVQVWRIGAWPA